MAEGIIRRVWVHYRVAKLEGSEQAGTTLQEVLDSAMKTAMGQDVSQRLAGISTRDDGPQGCLNQHQSTPQAFVADVMHFDGRSHSLRWIKPNTPTPIAKIEPREISEDEPSLSEPVYIMVRGNHVAAIERPAFGYQHLARYLNGVLMKAGMLDKGTTWKLSPKLEYTGGGAPHGAVRRVVFKPRGAFDGYGETRAPEPKRKKKPAAQAVLDDVLSNAAKIIEILDAAGADQTKIETLRKSMSSDLAIRAKIELTVQKIKKKTVAEVSPEIMQNALADLADDGDVTIIGADGFTEGKLITLVHKAEVLEVAGQLDWTRATEALASALASWVAKGAIDIPNPAPA